MKGQAAYYTIIGLFLIHLPLETMAQHDLGIYNMQAVPQRLFQNPAFIPDPKVYIGIPVLSGVQSSYVNPFSYNDVIERDSFDSVTFRVENLLETLSESDKLRLYSNIDIFSLGDQISNGKFYLGFSIRERVSQHIMIPVELGYLLWYGNAATQLFGQNANISPSVDFIAFDEWGASFSGYAIGQKMTWGGRLKYLSGRINATTKSSTFEVYTDSSTYNIYMRSDLELRTSGIDNIEHYLDQRVGNLVFPGNNGVGIDLGASYRFNDKFSISASVLDIGFIRWKSNTMILKNHNPGAEFVFKGLTLKDFVEVFSDLGTFGTKMTDSILELVDIDTIYDVKYTSWLPVRYNAGGSFSLNEFHHFNLLINGISWNHHFYPALSVSYYYKLRQKVGILVSYNIFNKQFTNIGAGISLRAGPIQLYAVSDNLPGLIFYHETNNSSLQFGINFLINPRKQVVTEEESEQAL